jgi:hypothetical protein
VELETTGESRFLKRLESRFEFQTEAASKSAGTPVRIIQRLNWHNWIAKLLVALQAHYPMVVVATRK